MADTTELTAPAKQRPRTPLPGDREAVKALSLSGLTDDAIALKLHVRPGTIRQWRSRDPAWSAAWSAAKASAGVTKARNEAVTKSVTKALVTENLAEIWHRTTPRIARAASSALSSFSKAPAEIENWADAKTALGVLAKATGQDKPAQVVNLNLWGDSTKTVTAGDSGTDVDPGMEDWMEAEIAEGLDGSISELD